MISPELLHHYPFFSSLKPAQLSRLAAVAREENYEGGSVIYREKDHTDSLYILVKGWVDLLFMIEADNPEPKELLFGEVSPGEVFGLSALLEPNFHTSTARAARSSQVIKIKSGELERLCQEDDKLAYNLMRKIAKTTAARLNHTRLQLATTITTNMVSERK